MKNTRGLTEQVERLSQFCNAGKVGKESLLCPAISRSRSVSDLEISGLPPMAGVVSMAGVDADKTKSKKQRRCHQCHTPLEEAVHVGVKSGVGVCPLPHWEDCDGDIPEGQEARGQIWAPCPKDDPVVTSSDDSRSRSNSGSSTEIEIDE